MNFYHFRDASIEAAGTTRSGNLFPALISHLRYKYCKELKWGTTIAISIDQQVLCIGWQDNNLVLDMTTVHTVHNAHDKLLRERKRPALTSTNAKITREEFGDLHI